MKLKKLPLNASTVQRKVSVKNSEIETRRLLFAIHYPGPGFQGIDFRTKVFLRTSSDLFCSENKQQQLLTSIGAFSDTDLEAQFDTTVYVRSLISVESTVESFVDTDFLYWQLESARNKTWKAKACINIISSIKSPQHPIKIDGIIQFKHCFYVL